MPDFGHHTHAENQSLLPFLLLGLPNSHAIREEENNITNMRIAVEGCVRR